MILLATIPVVAAILISLRLPHRDVSLRRDGGRRGRRPGRGPQRARPVRVDPGWRVGGERASSRGLPAAVWAAAIVAVYLNVMNGLLQSFFPLLGIAAGPDARPGGHCCPSIRVGVSSRGAVRCGHRSSGSSDPSYLHWPLLTMSACDRDGAALDRGLDTSLTVPFLALNGISRGLLRVTTGAAAMDALRGQQAGAAAAVMTAGLDVGKMIGPLLGGLVAGAVRPRGDVRGRAARVPAAATPVFYIAAIAPAPPPGPRRPAHLTS